VRVTSLEQLESVGVDVDALPSDQRQVLETLSEQEIATLSSVHARVNAGSDVEGHRNDQGAIFW
jgi:hypothetical protein